MRRIRSSLDNMSLRMRITVSILLALMVTAGCFFMMSRGTRYAIDSYFDDDTKWKQKTDTKAIELQAYISSAGVSKSDWEKLRSWNHRNSGVYLYIYDSEGTIYETSRSVTVYSYQNSRPLVFSDGKADLSIYYAIGRRYYSAIMIVELVLSIVLFMVILLKIVNNVVFKIKRLENDVKILEGGSLDHEIQVHGRDEIGSLEKSIDDMRKTIRENIAREAELISANNDLVTRMAHDLRTPLTSLLLYLDLIENHRYKNEEQLEQYVRISRDKAQGIKQMSDQLFERFLITGGKEDTLDEPHPVRYILEDPLSSFVMTLETQGYCTVTDFDWPEALVSVIPDYINRIMDNVYSNILKYAEITEPIVVELRDFNKDGRRYITLMISNHIGKPRSSTGSSNIGIKNVELMLSKMGGFLTVDNDGTVFAMNMSLPESAAADRAELQQ